MRVGAAARGLRWSGPGCRSEGTGSTSGPGPFDHHDKKDSGLVPPPIQHTRQPLIRSPRATSRKNLRNLVSTSMVPMKSLWRAGQSRRIHYRARRKTALQATKHKSRQFAARGQDVGHSAMADVAAQALSNQVTVGSPQFASPLLPEANGGSDVLR